jgi:hypothetical protein
MYAKLNIVKWGLSLSIITILLGFIIGAAMGGAEEQIKDYWKASADQVISTVYNNDHQKVATIIDKSWTSLKRAHIHAAAIGSTTLILIYILSCLTLSNIYKQIISLFLGIGSVGYSLAWLYTAFKLPIVGSIPATKASIHILAASSIGMLLLGTIFVLSPVVIGLFNNQSQQLPDKS